MLREVGLNKLRFNRVASSDGMFGVQVLNLILAFVGTKYQFYHRGKLTKSTKTCHFR